MSKEVLAKLDEVQSLSKPGDLDWDLAESVRELWEACDRAHQHYGSVSAQKAKDSVRKRLLTKEPHPGRKDSCI